MSESDLYKRGLGLAGSGDHAGALSLIQRHLESCPEDGEAWNDAGVLLYRMGHCREATGCFERASELDCERGQLCSNLFHAYMADGRIGEGVSLLGEMHHYGLLADEFVGGAVGTLVQQGNIGDAMEVAIEVDKLAGSDGRMRRVIENIRARRAKIAFFCGGDGETFLQDIYEFVGRRFEYRVFEGNTVEQVRDLMEWSDISWFEWCTSLAEVGSKLPKVCRNIVRLHRYEAHQGWGPKINWANVDTLITVGNRSVEELLCMQVPDLKRLTRMVTIPNGINLGKIRFIRRRRGKNIAFVGNFRMVKNPMFALQCMKKLHEIDGEYKLFIAGKSQDLDVEQYFYHMRDALGLREAVVFDGWQSDIGGWLGDKHYIALTSVIESQGMGVLEGMAMGLKGIIHNFPGADGIYPRELLFNTTEEFCDVIMSNNYSPGEYRAFVERKYALGTQLGRIDEILRGFERNPYNGVANGRLALPGVLQG